MSRRTQDGDEHSACMLIFAAAADAASGAARQALAQVCREAEPASAELAAPTTDAWRYHHATLDSDAHSAARAAATPRAPTSPGELSAHDHATASTEVQYWQRALQRLCEGRGKSNCAATHATHVLDDDEARGEASAPSVLWTRVPRGGSAIDESVAAPPDGGCGVPQTQLLCIDVGGYYSRSPETSLAEPSNAQCARSGASATTFHSQSSAASRFARPGDAAAQRLACLAQHRFASALPLCPTASPALTHVVLQEVWVVALGSAGLHCAGVSEDGFSHFVRCIALAACSADGPDSTAELRARLAGYPPRHVLRLPDWLACAASSPWGHGNGAPGAEAGIARTVALPRGFKRPREEAVAVAPTPQQGTGGGSGVLLVSCDTDAVSTAVRVRPLHRAFLQRSVLFSEWCCAADFDETAVSAAEPGDAAAVPATGVHGVYAALQRAHLFAETDVRAAARRRLVQEIEARTPLAAPTSESLRAGAAVEALFEDPAVVTQRTGSTNAGSRTAAAVVVFEDLWRWWVLLGWTPALTRTPLRVRLPSPPHEARDATPPDLVAELPPGAVCRLLARVAADVDRCHIHARSSHTERQAATLKREASVASHETTLSGASPIPSSGVTAETDRSAFTTRREALLQVQQLLRFRTALLLGVPGGDLPAVAAGTTHTTEVCSEYGSVDPLHSADAVLSEAAGELAADITAVTSTTATGTAVGQAGQSPVDPSPVASFAVPWLRGVLDAPALLFCPPQTTLEALLHADGVAPLRASCGGSDGAPPVASLLPRRRGAHEPTLWPLPPGDAATQATLASGEAGCEVADVAELRWWSATAPERQLSAASSELWPVAPALADASSVASSSCGRARRAIARLARCHTTEEAAAVRQEAAQGLRSTDPLAALLFVKFVALLEGSGAVVPSAAKGQEKAVEPTEAAPAAHVTPTMTPPTSLCGTPPVGAEDEAREALAAPRAPAAAAIEPAVSRHDAERDEGADAAPEVLLQANEKDAVAACVADAVIRVVQQNRLVVRRMLALVQSCQTVVDDVTAAREGDEGGGAELPTTEARAAEALAGDVWRCVSASTCKPSMGNAVSVRSGAHVPPSDVSASATAAAQRLVRAFWENVAATVRLRLAPRDGAGVAGGADMPCRSEDDDATTPQSTDARSDDACSEEAEEEMKSVGDAGHMSSTLSATAAPPARAADAAPTDAAPTPARARAPPPTALSCALAALDGARAMALYMQRIACASGSRATSATTPHCGSRLGHVLPRLRATASSTDYGASQSGQQLWVQHALFLLSFGLACPTEHASAPTANAAGCAAASIAPPSPPALAAFRALRRGKLVLDAWIVAALEAYVQRWEHHIPPHLLHKTVNE